MPGRSIVGLMATQTGDTDGLGLLNPNDRKSFINQVFGQNGIFKRSVYSIAIEPSGDLGELILGGVHKGIKGWVPIVPASEFPLLYYSPQWVIRVKRLLAVGNSGEVLADLPIEYCRFDTGNTWFSMPSAVFKKEGHLGELPGIAGVQIKLENDVHLWFPAALWAGSVEMANATGFGGLAEDDSLQDNMCIFGNEVMRGMTVACDLANAKLGFGGMCTVVGDENLMDCMMHTPPELDNTE